MTTSFTNYSFSNYKLTTSVCDLYSSEFYAESSIQYLLHTKNYILIVKAPEIAC